MKIVQFCDLHHSNKPAILRDIQKCEDFALQHITPLNPDLIVIAGDLYDEGVSLGSQAAITAALFVHRCANIAPTILIRGTSTHDAEGQIALLDKIRAVYPIYATDRLEQVFFTGHDFFNQPIDPELCRAVISCLPSINKAGLMAAAAGTVDETNKDAIELLRDVFHSWGIVNREAMEQEIPTILIGHCTVVGSEFSSGQLATGKDLEVTPGDLHLAECGLYLLGHIHKKQIIATDIYYGGSITRLNYGEQEEKGFFIFESGNPDVGYWAYEFVPTPAREMKTKRPEGLPTTELLDDVQPGDSVRIVYEVAEEDVVKVDEKELERIALEKGAADVKIEKRIIPKVRVRAEGISQEHSNAGKLQRWGEVTGQEITDGLADKLKMLEEDDVEKILEGYEIAQEVLNGPAAAAA